ncbi:MAG: DUF4965 domain-containing protein [Prevotellaceae bacterium]|jgi:hypothetical protein|nr:DUF4965 domain-containing protein [Prevotellaceae bacterium]
MRQIFLLSFVALFTACQPGATERVPSTLRAPAVPLVTVDPYTSAWSFTDELYGGTVRHWTGADFPLLGVITVDGEDFRFLGKEKPVMEPVAPSSEQQPWDGKYTTAKPGDGWMSENFNDAKWKDGTGAFGTISRDREATAKTDWIDREIWVRRTVDVHAYYAGKDIYLEYSNDDDAEFYINGQKIIEVECCNKNKLFKLPDEAVKLLREGKNLIAAHCSNPVANGLIDFGLYVEKEHSIRYGQAAVQQSVDVQATQTHYTFACGKVNLKLTFTAPLLMNRLDLLARPVNYISFDVTSADGQPHDVAISFEASSQWATNTPYQQTVCNGFEQDNLIFVKTGTKEQDILAKKGDDLRIDWGYFYMAAEKSWLSTRWNSSVENSNPLSVVKLEKQVEKTKQFSDKIMLGYDDIYSIQYFGENLRPYWNRSGEENIVSQFQKANSEYAKVIAACSRFDAELMQQAAAAGGREYAELCALAYRQAVAAHKLVQAPNGDLLFLSKENFSNGSIGTVDITYPSAPVFLLYSPELCKGLLNHIFYYSESGKWTKPFAAHDVGTYPIANGQTYGGDMPVEESGNMLIITAAIASREGSAGYAEKHWEVLTTWADYLVENGLDPENQLCTDDFAGHFAHNANLSIKAILGITSYGRLADMLGKKEVAEKYTATAKEMARQWIAMADDGDHYRLTFDKSGTWSQKYNLVWDKLLNLGIFPSEVAEKEVAYYLTKQNPYGLPLDSRETYTKADWVVWTATLAGDREIFEQLIHPLHTFANVTPDRAPMTDWYFTDRPNQRGFKVFQARSVVGGFFIKMLESK